MTLLLTLLLLILGLFSCSHPEPEYIQRTYQLQKAFSRQALKNDNLQLYLYGGALMHNIKEIDIGFFSSQPMGIEEARMLYVKNAEAFLSMINSDEIARPYLNVYPFTIANIKLTIIFFDQKKDFIHPPYLASVFNVGQRIVYTIKNLETNGLDDALEETYEDALRIYHENLKSFENSPSVNPRIMLSD